MTTRHNTIYIPVGDRRIAGTLVAPDTLVPGVLLVHGWDGSQEQYITRAHAIAALGCICLTFDLRGHAEDRAERDMVTREDNLTDLLAAYDTLVSHPAVDNTAVAVIGSSYGGYLAAVLTTLRKVRWIGLRAPALYKDEHWLVPKRQLNKEEIAAYRQTVIPPAENRALAACTQFEGDVLLVESEHDSTVPHPVIENYRNAFSHAHSMTYRVIKGADHALGTQEMREAYSTTLVKWMGEMIEGARHKAKVQAMRNAATSTVNGAGLDGRKKTPPPQKSRSAKRMVSDLKHFLTKPRSMRPGGNAGRGSPN